MTVSIRYATLDDAVKCNAFHNQHYHNTRSAQQWKWLYASSLRNGGMVPFLVAEDGDRVVGTQAIIPIAMIDNGGVYWTAKAEETLVDTDYRQFLLFVRLYQTLFADANEQGIVSIWGFSWASRMYETLLHFDSPATTCQVFRPLSSKGIGLLLDRYFGNGDRPRPKVVRLLGDRLCGTLATSVSTAIAATSSVFSRQRAVPGLELTTLSGPPEKAEELCAAFVRQWGGATVFRDVNYMQWRFFDNPFTRATLRAAYVDGRLVGWVAYALDDDSIGYIVDAVVAAGDSDRNLSRNVTRLLVRDVVRRLQKAGALGIRSWHVNNHPFDKMLLDEMKSTGFFLIRKGEPMVVYPRLSDCKTPSLRNFDNWFVSRAYTQGSLG